MKNTFLLAILFLLGACGASKLSPTGELIIDHIEGHTIHAVDGRTVELSGMGQGSQKTFFLVRHAEKSGEPGNDPRLSEAGNARATKLAKILQKVHLDKIYSTDYHRTRDTAQPLATQLPLDISSYPPREQDAFFDQIVAQTNAQNMLVVGHSNTIPMLINSLLGEEKYPSLGHDDYDDFFIVMVKGENKVEVMELKY